jgi:hypothetical protein
VVACAKKAYEAALWSKRQAEKNAQAKAGSAQ